MKKSLLFCLIILVFLGTLSYPHAGFASVLSDIEKELSKVKQQEEALKRKREETASQSNTLKSLKTQEIQSMDNLLKDIDVQGAKLNELAKQMNVVQLSLLDAGEELQVAGDRVSARDVLLKSRLRLMYMNGTVSYFDVLLSATSFSDFLDRFFALKNIVGQDRKILEANKKDREVIEVKKKQVEDQLTKVKALSASAESIKQQLFLEEKKKEVNIASLAQKEKEVEGINEDVEKEIIALAKQRAALNLKKDRALRATNFVYKGGKLSWPVPGKTFINSSFGSRMDPFQNVPMNHNGIDIPAPNGTKIVAAESGRVLIASWVRGYGNTVVIDHGAGLWTWYGHIREGGLKVSEGQKVLRDQVIAEVGSTGNSTGNHLHFEVRLREAAVNPLPYLK